MKRPVTGLVTAWLPAGYRRVTTAARPSVLTAEVTSRSSCPVWSCVLGCRRRAAVFVRVSGPYGALVNVSGARGGSTPLTAAARAAPAVTWSRTVPSAKQQALLTPVAVECSRLSSSTARLVSDAEPPFRAAAAAAAARRTGRSGARPGSNVTLLLHLNTSRKPVGRLSRGAPARQIVSRDSVAGAPGGVT